LTEKPIPRGEWLAMLACCAVASMAALAWSWQNEDLLNYGDAVAHLHIARRVFDARLPRISELGSVWLPLPHLLMMPFVQVYSWWADGIAGAIPSVLAYMAGCAGLYRLSRRWMGRTPAAMTLVFFAANPNLLYLQTTGMTEPLFVCEMIWLADLLVEWRANLKPAPERARKLLWWVAAVLVAAVYTRYDGWIMALLAWTGIGLVLARSGKLRSRTFWLASAVVVAAPLVWFAYNAATGATGWSLCAGRSRPRPSSCAPPRRYWVHRIRAGTILGSRCCSLPKRQRWTPWSRPAATSC